jgi:co-chaperonin GroES (HSP10)
MLYPLNRYLVVAPSKKKEESPSSVLIPDDVEIDDSKYCLVTLLEPHEDSELTSGMCLVVPSHSLEKITIQGEDYYVVPENHVTGFFGENEF